MFSLGYSLSIILVLLFLGDLSLLCPDFSSYGINRVDWTHMAFSILLQRHSLEFKLLVDAVLHVLSVFLFLLHHPVDRFSLSFFGFSELLLHHFGAAVFLLLFFMEDWLFAAWLRAFTSTFVLGQLLSYVAGHIQVLHGNIRLNCGILRLNSWGLGFVCLVLGLILRVI